ncbi:hypothetical protein BD310DRAFT_775402, partial [Dichomitus squalens]
PGARPASKLRAREEISAFKDYWIEIAAQRYQTEKETKGARTVCQEVEAECLRETNTPITLNKNTVMARAKGNMGIREFNAGKGWLTKGEEEQVADFAVETARRGFPLTH